MTRAPEAATTATPRPIHDTHSQPASPGNSVSQRQPSHPLPPPCERDRTGHQNPVSAAPKPAHRHSKPSLNPTHRFRLSHRATQRTAWVVLLFAAGISPLALERARAADYVGSGSAVIDDGSWGSVYGLRGQPRTGNAQAEQSTVTISGGTVSRSVYGGYARSNSGTAQAGSNTVTITGMSGSAYSFYGGYARSEAGNAAASSNTLNISGSPVFGSYPQAVGGYAYGSNTTAGRILSTNNRVSINLDSNETLDLIVGGRSSASTSPGTATGAYGNSITLTQGQVTTLYGGWSNGDGTADASNNTVLISGGQATHIIGGEAFSVQQEAVADGNIVSITGGTHTNILAASVQSDESRASASDNAVYLSHTTVEGVTGGYSTNTTTPATLDGNSIVVDTGAVVLTDVHGGDSTSSSAGNSASNNSIAVVNGGRVQGELAGGDLEAGSGASSSNTILVSGGSVGGNVYGGRTAQGGDASSNSITVEKGGHVQGNLVSGDLGAGSGTASRNSVLISEGTVAGNISGGRAAAGGQVSSNSISVQQGSQVQGSLVGGEVNSGSGVASTNTVVVSASTVGGSVCGGSSSDGGEANGNTLTVKESSQINGDLMGGNITVGSGTASQNTILVSNGTVGGNVCGGTTGDGGDASSNSITVEQGAQVDGDLMGGNVTSGSGTASQNTILVDTSTIDGSVYGGRTLDGGDASHNTLAVTGGSRVKGELVGGDLGTGKGSASHNTIVINNGTAEGDICGGRTAEGGSATGNNIIIGHKANLAPTISLFGGIAGSQPVAPVGSGNTLFVDNWQGTVERVAGFANLHFVLPAPGTVATDVPMLTVSTAQPGDFSGTTVTAQLPDIITGGRAHIGETFELVHDASGAVAQAHAGSLVSLQQGYAALYDGVILQDATSIYIRLDDSRPNPKAGALTEARIGTAGLLNQGGDLLAGAVLFAADQAARETMGWAVFATMYGGAADLTTESDITTQGFSLVTGLTHQNETPWAQMLVGAFFEMGTAHMDTDRALTGVTISGSGDADYAGGGLFGRLGISRGRMRGLYIEASGRVGEATTSWHSGNLLDNLDRPAAYDLAMPYAGGHVGVGFTVPIREKWAVDFFSKYLFLYQDGCDTTINGERFRFDSVYSSRLRSGARLSGRVLPTTVVYLGAAWEHEFSGKAKATSLSSQISIPSTSMQGNSGVFELGVTVHPESMPVRFDVAVEGAAGTRKSIGGRVQVMVEF